MLRSDASGHLKWHCDAAFALHNDFRSHTGSSFLMGGGARSKILWSHCLLGPSS